MSGVLVGGMAAAFVLFVVLGGACLLLAQRKDAQLTKAAPGSLSYKWGYFLAYSGLLLAVFVAIAGVVMLVANVYAAWAPATFGYAVAFGIASYGVLLRRKWGWLLHIPLSLNMGLWAFNSVYVHNRWREFA